MAAVPIFIEFMKEALKGTPKLDFVAPPGTVFAQVGPNREAFRPGTIPVHAAPSAGGGAGAAPERRAGARRTASSRRPRRRSRARSRTS